MINTDFGFLQPVWLYFIPLIWLLWFVYKDAEIIWPKWLPSMTIRYPELGNIKSLSDISKTHKPQYYHVQNVILALVFSLFLFTLSQPVQYLGLIDKQKQNQPLDMIIAIDTALSMSLKDYLINNQPVSRLDMVKQSLADFLPQFNGSRMALVVLGSPPSVLLPLTVDKAVVRFQLMRLTTFLGGRITDTGATLQLIDAQFSNPGEKVVVVISDGGTQVGSVSPQDAAQGLVKKGFIIHTIAVGASKPLNKSSLLYEPVNLTMLKKLAQKGKGQKFHALDTQTFIQALNEIQSRHLLKTSVNTENLKPVKQNKQLSRGVFMWSLIPALLLLLLLGVMHAKRSKDVA